MIHRRIDALLDDQTRDTATLLKYMYVEASATAIMHIAMSIYCMNTVSLLPPDILHALSKPLKHLNIAAAEVGLSEGHRLRLHCLKKRLAAVFDRHNTCLFHHSSICFGQKACFSLVFSSKAAFSTRRITALLEFRMVHSNRGKYAKV